VSPLPSDEEPLLVAPEQGYDCDVDALDAQQTAGRYLFNATSPYYRAGYDLQGGPDGEIDIQDIQYVNGRIGSTCASPAPAEPTPNTQSSGLTATPSGPTAVTTGQTVNVTVALTSPLDDVGALDVGVLYDHNLFEIFETYTDPSTVTYSSNIQTANYVTCLPAGGLGRVGCMSWSTAWGTNPPLDLSGDLVTFTFKAKQNGTASFTPYGLFTDAWGQEIFSTGTPLAPGPVNLDPSWSGQRWTVSFSAPYSDTCSFTWKQFVWSVQLEDLDCAVAGSYPGPFGAGTIDTHTGVYRLVIYIGAVTFTLNGTVAGAGGGSGQGGGEGGAAGSGGMLDGTWTNDQSQSGSFTGEELGLPSPGDSDDDGCPDADENGSMVTSGGMRDWENAYDYFNPTHDGKNRTDDILKVVLQFFVDDTDESPGLPPYSEGYNPDTDRTDDPAYGPEQPWRLLGPNGQQRVDDILHSVRQFFHDCP
jgi:hypothetical protein